MRGKVAMVIEKSKKNPNILQSAFSVGNPFTLSAKDMRHLKAYFRNYNKLFVNF